MTKAQMWTIISLLGVLLLAVCWHFYRTEQYRQEQLSIERVGLGIKYGQTGSDYIILGPIHESIKGDKRILAKRNKPRPPPSPAEEQKRIEAKAEMEKMFEETREKRRAEREGKPK